MWLDDLLSRLTKPLMLLPHAIEDHKFWLLYSTLRQSGSGRLDCDGWFCRVDTFFGAGFKNDGK